jgi:hypothetical protein
MDRRTFVATLAGGLAVGPWLAGAQAGAKAVKIGVLRAAPDGGPFRQYFLGLTVPRSLLARADKLIE